MNISDFFLRNELQVELSAKTEEIGVRRAQLMEMKDALEKGIEAHGASLVADVQSSEWALLDEYAYWIPRHQADLLWVQATGSRAPSFGVLPYENKSNDSEQDVFEGEDVFGEDVFGEDRRSATGAN